MKEKDSREIVQVGLGHSGKKERSKGKDREEKGALPAGNTRPIAGNHIMPTKEWGGGWP